MLIDVVRFSQSVILFALLAGSSLLGNSSNPPNGYHGESLSCADCHSGNLNTGDGSISISGLPTTYSPGQTYDLVLTVLGSNSRGYGFQLFPKANGINSGSITTVSSGMGVENGAAEHRGTSFSGSWNFRWTAPATDQGTVTFYASGLATGGTSGNDGDYVYTMAQDIPSVSFTHASEEWNASTGGVIFSSPTIGADGSVYIGSNDNKLHAFNSDGSTKWTFTSGNWVDSTPAISSDGTIYVGSWDNKVYAINSDNGSKIWEYETNSYVIASPALGADGKVYVGSKDSIFYAFESNGSVAWEYFAGQSISSSAALGQDGTIYFGDENGTFHAVNPDGSPKWTYEVEDVADTNKSILSSPALDLSGNIYFGSGNGNCYSITDNGQSASLNWLFPTSDRVDASPVLGINDEVFFVSRDGYLRSLSTLTGNLNWDAFVGDVFYSSPVVDQNGRTYVIGYTGGGENHLFAFDSDGTKAWDTNDTECPFEIGGIVDASLALSSDGKLYYGCYDNRIYCIDVGTSPASSDWSMFQRSGRRDGAWPSYFLETSVSPIGVASISGAGIYNEGATTTVTLSSISDGYSFSQWTGGASGSDNPLNITINSSTSVTANFLLNQYSLSVNAGTGGNVTGSGTFDHGTNTNITAIPQTGYYFSGWSGQGIADLNAASTTVSMTEARTVTASFTPLTFSISASVNPSGTGQVTGTGNYQFGEEVNLTATSSLSGYSFLSWSGDINSTENPVILNIDSNLSLTANFSLNTYSLEISAGIGGTVSGNGNFTHGTLAAINAIPNSGYSFAGWSGDGGVGDLNAMSTTVEMSQDRTLTASFTLNQYSLNLLAGDGGIVIGEGNFTHGSNASISAIADVGYIFRGWTGVGVNDQNATATTVSMTQNRTVTALFDLKNYFLNLDSSTGGSVIGGGNYNHGEVVTITASPNSGYQFENWNGDIDGNLSSPNRTITIDSNKSISANFVEVTENNFVLTILSTPLTGGSSSGAGSYPADSSVPIVAEPQTGYEFVSWAGSGIHDLNSSNTNILLSENRTITANFQKRKYLLQINEVDGGSVSGEGHYEYGTEANITALPNEGYLFSGWLGTGIDNPGSEFTTIAITEDKNITASFEALSRTLILNSTTGGTVRGSGTFPYGTEIEIQATPQNGYLFTKWIGSLSADVESSNLVFQLYDDLNLTAEFSRETYKLSLKNSLGGSTSGGGLFYYNAFAPIAAYPEAGYTFERWEGEGVFDPHLPFTTVNLKQDQNITAIFSLELITNKINSVQQIGPSWYDSSWFGTFFQMVDGWAYHLEFGWIYPIINYGQNIWFWHANHGWIWLNEESFSDKYMWANEKGNWLFWDHTTNRFFDYGYNQWMLW